MTRSNKKSVSTHKIHDSTAFNVCLGEIRRIQDNKRIALSDSTTKWVFFYLPFVSLLISYQIDEWVSFFIFSHSYNYVFRFSFVAIKNHLILRKKRIKRKWNKIIIITFFSSSSRARILGYYSTSLFPGACVHVWVRIV